jgi:hypothetical protein
MTKVDFRGGFVLSLLSVVFDDASLFGVFWGFGIFISLFLSLIFISVIV